MKVKIGLETHVQLNTESKIFCSCRNPVNLKEEPEPNTLTCECCLGMPGSKPLANRRVLDMATSVGLALGCDISRSTYFSRKTYFYPDQAKNFQITQYEIPLAEKGTILVGKKRIRIRRLHMEEDPAKLVHIGGLGGRYVLVDYNRSGIPLIEIVTEPDLETPREARLYLQKLVTILEYLGEVTVAPVTRTVRDIPSEVFLSREDGMAENCAVNLDHIQTVSKDKLGQVITRLSADRLARVSHAVRFALDL